MRRSVGYATIAVFVISYLLAGCLIYFLFRDDEQMFYVAICILSMAVMLVTMALALILSRPSASEAYSEYAEKRREKKDRALFPGFNSKSSSSS